MNLVRTKALLAFLLMASFAALGHFARPTTHMADTRPPIDLEQLFPKAFGEWTTDSRMPVQLISPDLAETLNKIYNQVLSRTYVNPQGQRIMLSVAYGGDQSDGTSAHRPEVCYPAQGFEILSAQDGDVSTVSHPVRVKHLVARLGGRIEPITYWIVVGDKVAITGTQQKWAQMQYGLRGVIADGMLVRVSSIDADANAAYAVQSNFVSEMVKATSPDARVRIIGSAGA